VQQFIIVHISLDYIQRYAGVQVIAFYRN